VWACVRARHVIAGRTVQHAGVLPSSLTASGRSLGLALFSNGMMGYEERYGIIADRTIYVFFPLLGFAMGTYYYMFVFRCHQLLKP